MEDNEKEVFEEELKTKNDPVEQWPINKLKKEVQGDAGKGQVKEKDNIGIE